MNEQEKKDLDEFAANMSPACAAVAVKFPPCGTIRSAEGHSHVIPPRGGTAQIVGYAEDDDGAEVELIVMGEASPFFQVIGLPGMTQSYVKPEAAELVDCPPESDEAVAYMMSALRRRAGC